MRLHNKTMTSIIVHSKKNSSGTMNVEKHDTQIHEAFHILKQEKKNITISPKLFFSIPLRLPL